MYGYGYWYGYGYREIDDGTGRGGEEVGWVDRYWYREGGGGKVDRYWKVFCCSFLFFSFSKSWHWHCV